MSRHVQDPAQRGAAHGHHCRRIAHDGGLSAVHPDALLLLRRLGRELVVAEGRKLRAAVLIEDEGSLHARPDWELELECPAAALADTPGGVLVAWNADERTVLALANSSGLSGIASVPGSFSALAAGGREALVATRQTDSLAGRVWRIDIGLRTVIAERPLPSAQVDLQLDLAGNWLTMVDRTAATVTTMPATLEDLPATMPAVRAPGVYTVAAGPGPTPANESKERHPPCCYCCICVPAGRNGGTEPGSPGGTQPGGTQPGGTQPGGTQPGGTQPGGAGVPTGNGGTVVGQGDRVGHPDPGGDGTIPCQLDFLWLIDRLIQTFGFVVAMDAERRNLAVMGLQPFRIVQERQFGRAGYRVALDREAPVMLVRHLGRPDWELVHLDALDQRIGPIGKWWPPPVAPESAEFYGVHVLSLMGGHAPTSARALG